MSRKPRQKKFYLVVSRDRGYKYGAFPYTPEGKKQAEDLIAKKKKDGEDLLIQEK